MKLRTLLPLLPLLAAPAFGGSKEPVEVEPKADDKNNGDWCEWLQDDPGLLYDKGKNPYIQKVEIGGRFQYQVAHLDGNDVRGRDFNDQYDEFRRVRLEAEVEFLEYFTAVASVNLVDDRRYNDSPPFDLGWGYDDFDELSLGFDVDKAFGEGPFDRIELYYGRMKLEMGEESHQSSREILTIERSAISDKIGGDEGRPTGVKLELEKGDWEVTAGVFSGEDDSDALGGWNDGYLLYGSVAWEPNKRFRMVYDHVQNRPDGIDRALGYAWAGSLSGIYEHKRWGLLVNGVYGDNGGPEDGNVRDRRQGDFWGAVVMPWYWIAEDRLQVVAAYQYQGADESEGIRVANRYLLGNRGDRRIDVDNGRGNEDHTFYAGLNYYLCGDNLKLMGGVTYQKLNARTGDVSALTYLLAFRTYF